MLVFNNTFTTETKLYDTSSQGVFVLSIFDSDRNCLKDRILPKISLGYFRNSRNSQFPLHVSCIKQNKSAHSTGFSFLLAFVYDRGQFVLGQGVQEKLRIQPPSVQFKTCVVCNDIPSTLYVHYQRIDQAEHIALNQYKFKNSGSSFVAASTVFII